MPGCNLLNIWDKHPQVLAEVCATTQDQFECSVLDGRYALVLINRWPPSFTYERCSMNWRKGVDIKEKGYLRSSYFLLARSNPPCAAQPLLC